MSLSAGDLKHRVVIEAQIDTQDSNGDTVVDWYELATVWAGYQPLSVHKFSQSRADQSEIAAWFTLRYRDDVDSTMRIRFRDRLHYIVGVLPDKESGLEYMSVSVKAGVRDGDVVSEIIIDGGGDP